MPTPIRTDRTRRLLGRQSRGFTLIEVLVALLVFALGVMGAIAMQAQAVRLSVESTERNRAALMANELAVLMWAQRSTALSEEQLADWEARLTDEQSQGLRGASYSISEPDADGAVEVVITWTSAVRGANAAEGRYETRVAVP